MTQLLNRLTIGKQLAVLIGSALVGIFALAAVFLASERQLILEERQQSVRQNVEVAYGVIVHSHDQFTKGKLTEDQAKQGAIAAIKGLRYSEKEYFWINDMRPTIVMHAAKPELDGKDATEIKDPAGKRVFVEFVNTVKASGAGFVFYLWPKLGSDQPVKKLSYVKGFQPWGWVLGSGVYIDTIDATLMLRVAEMSLGAIGLATLMLVIGLLVARSLVGQLGGELAYAKSITQSIAAGDLGTEIKLRSGDRSSLLFAIQSMRDSFGTIVGRVREGSQAVASASNQIAQGNADLSQRTERQAASLQETAASMEELSSTVRKNTDDARRANDLAQGASQVACAGGEIVGEVVQTMKGISESAKRIADITGTIDGIAFQTNILALNAAVEAARAGEHGRGFSVVASEVRTLAGRSAAAAKEIKALIGNSVTCVEQGSELVDKAGVTMAEVVAAIGHVKDIVAEISVASIEQSQGIAQVGVAVTQIDAATQQNAALVDQSAAAAESLNQQAQSLVKVMSVFNLR